MPPLTKSDSLGDALSAAMSAVELGGEAFQQLSAAENRNNARAKAAGRGQALRFTYEMRHRIHGKEDRTQNGAWNKI